MPSALMLTDSSFPRFTDEQPTGEKLDTIYNYLYMLLEQLRYSLSNLEITNFNDTGFSEIEEIIQEPVKEEIKAITSRLENDEGTISQLTQTATSLTSRISNAEGSITKVSQTLNALTFEVSNGTTSSTIRLMSGEAEITSARIEITGMVTFGDLRGEGTTTINGANIKTGTISAIDIEGCTITGSQLETVLDADGSVSGEINCYYIDKNYLAGGIKLDDTGSGDDWDRTYRMFIYTNYVNGVGFGLKLLSAGGMSLESEDNIYMQASSYIRLEAPVVRIDFPEIWSDNGFYTFEDGGIYFNGKLLVSTAG